MRGAPEERKGESRIRGECEREEERRKREEYEEERLREERGRERRVQEAQEWSEKSESDQYHDRVTTKFDHESVLANGVEEFETKTRFPSSKRGSPCTETAHGVGGEILGGSRLNMDHTMRTARDRRRVWRAATRSSRRNRGGEVEREREIK